MLGKSPKVMDEPITKILCDQLDIKLEPFTQEELDAVLRKINNSKAAGLNEISPEVWKTRKFDNILLRYCNTVYNGIMVILAGNGHGDTSSNPGRD